MNSLFPRLLSGLLILSLGFTFSCKKENKTTLPVSNPDLATITIDRFDSIGFRSVHVVSTVLKEGKSSIVKIGFTFSKFPNPTIGYNRTVPYSGSGSGPGSYILRTEILEPGTLYYVRCFATNAEGTAYSEQKTFTTLAFVAPTLTTGAVTNIGPRFAMATGTISNQGSSPVLEKGFVWSTSPDPTIEFSGSIASLKGAGSGTFTLPINGLSLNTKYFLRAYATNGERTGYGNTVVFTTLPPPTSVSDIDGNTYPTVQIGNQIWMAENLKTSRYQDGSVIPLAQSDSVWRNISFGAYAIYGNLQENDAAYGKLYNLYSVADGRNLCPAGWHVPTSTEWDTLAEFLGGVSLAGGKMKTLTGWQAPNTDATNESGFSGLPGGSRFDNGAYPNSIHKFGHWWSQSGPNSNIGRFYFLDCKSGGFYNGFAIGGFGLSVRCILN